MSAGTNWNESLSVAVEKSRNTQHCACKRGTKAPAAAAAAALFVSSSVSDTVKARSQREEEEEMVAGGVVHGLERYEQRN